MTATFEEMRQANDAQFQGFVETVNPIILGDNLRFFRLSINGKQYDATVDVDPGDFITFMLMPDLFYYPGLPDIPVIRVLSFTNRFHSA